MTRSSSSTSFVLAAAGKTSVCYQVHACIMYCPLHHELHLLLLCCLHELIGARLNWPIMIRSTAPKSIKHPEGISKAAGTS